MLIETALHLAQIEGQGQPLNALMRKANELHAASSTGWQRPFAPVDIVFATFVDYMRASATQRERDLVVISDKLSRVWVALHSGLQTLREPLSPAEELDLSMLAAALKRQGLLHLLTDDLSQPLRQKVLDAAESDTPKNRENLKNHPCHAKTL